MGRAFVVSAGRHATRLRPGPARLGGDVLASVAEDILTAGARGSCPRRYDLTLKVCVAIKKFGVGPFSHYDEDWGGGGATNCGSVNGHSIPLIQHGAYCIGGDHKYQDQSLCADLRHASQAPRCWRRLSARTNPRHGLPRLGSVGRRPTPSSLRCRRALSASALEASSEVSWLRRALTAPGNIGCG